MRGQHSTTCATGARAELRGPCDCNAVDLPYRARLVAHLSPNALGKRMVEIQVDGPLTTSEAVEFSILLQELTKEEGQRWARSKRYT